MFIAADAMSESLPEDVQRMASGAASGTPTLEGGIDDGQRFGGGAPAGTTGRLDALALDRWDVQCHQYNTRAAVEMSVLARMFRGRGEASRCGIVQEAKRYCVSRSDTGRMVEHGTAVRLSVAVLNAEIDVALTLPNIAATAQLSNTTARISLSVDGYVGPLGEILPAPDNLNVENLEVFTSAFKELQALVFGADGLDYLAPTLLGYVVPDEEE